MESVKVYFTESCSILLVDKTKNDCIFHIVAWRKEEEIQKYPGSYGRGNCGDSLPLPDVPMIINDAQNDDRVYKVVDKASDFTTRNILAAPLIADDEVIGVMEGINTIDRNNFNDSDINYFKFF